MSAEEQITEVIQILNDLCGDPAIPKNVKLKIEEIVKTLKGESEISIKVNKALAGLDEISDDSNIEQFVRTQIWSAVSLLEKIS